MAAVTAGDLVAVIVGGASGFIGHQVSGRMKRIEVARQQLEIDRYRKCLTRRSKLPGASNFHRSEQPCSTPNP